MTTIAYKDGVIAWDSQSVRNGIVVDHNRQKRRVVKNVQFYLAGTVSDHTILIDLYFGKKTTTQYKDIDSIALALDGSKLMIVGIDPDTGLWTCPIRQDQPYAIGSGEHFALAAMDLGKTAKEAVSVAAHRDIYTGGQIHEERIFDGQEGSMA